MRTRTGTRNACAVVFLAILKQIVGLEFFPRRGASSAYSPKKIRADAAVSEKPAGSAGKQVSFVAHEELPADEKLVASVKRNGDSEPVAKTRKEGGRESIQCLSKPRKYWIPNRMRKPPKPAQRTGKERTSKKNAV